MLGKSRRVENDEVVVVTGLFQELESVFSESFVTLVAREVQFSVGAGQVDGLGTAVYRVNQVGTTTHGVYGETASVAEHVQDIASL